MCFFTVGDPRLPGGMLHFPRGNFITPTHAWLEITDLEGKDYIFQHKRDMPAHPLSFLNLDAQRNHEAMETTQAQVVGTSGSKLQSEEIANPHRMGLLWGLNEMGELIHEVNNT